MKQEYPISAPETIKPEVIARVIAMDAQYQRERVLETYGFLVDQLVSCSFSSCQCAKSGLISAFLSFRDTLERLIEPPEDHEGSPGGES
jgi:hypothetical protein